MDPRVRSRVAALLGALSAATAAIAQEPARPASVTVAAPPTGGENRHYAGHRAPLLPEPLLKLPVGSVRARGWLAQQLDRMASGMFGRLPEYSHWCRPENNAWRSKDGSGECGWEELPYWLKGFTSLAFLVDERAAATSGDPRLRELAVDWLEAILASQREDGYFGPESNRAQPDLWPNMPVLWALRTWHEATGDPRILAFLANYFRYELDLPRERLLPESWQKVRGGDNLDVVHWLYDRMGRTGEPWLLELAQRIHERTDDWTSGVANWHGVNFCQGFREPLQYFVQSHDPRHRDATARNYAEMMAKFGQMPGGMFAADENCRAGCADPRQGAEACSMVEYMLSFELLGAQTGDTVWFDRCEEVAFNSLPAAMDDELRSLHYLTPCNVAACDAQDHSPGFENGGCMLAFSPDERYRCCQHNVVQGWPYFVEHLWMATRDGGLAAVMYAPCEVRAKVGDGADVSIDVETGYPFDSGLVVKVRTTRPVTFPLYLRVPAWCGESAISLSGATKPAHAPAGQFLRIERNWTDGSELRIELPMTTRARRFPANHDCVAIDRGPLTYSLDIDEEWRVSEAEGAGKRDTAELLPASPWNFGLELQSAESMRYEPPGPPPQKYEPFAHRGAPRLHAKARKIPQWQLDSTGLVAPLQPSPVKSDSPVEPVELIPMGCARLRISAFPVIGAGPDAHEWKAPRRAASASHAHDDRFALDDGVLPKDSIDRTVPRFTFWDHLGTTEWVQYDFEQPRRIGRSAVYWFDDTGSGRCRVPKSWRILWLDDESGGGVRDGASAGTWREVTLAAADGYGVAPDRLNGVTFTPVTTKSLRLEVTLQPELSAGMFEWTAGE